MSLLKHDFMTLYVGAYGAHVLAPQRGEPLPHDCTGTNFHDMPEQACATLWDSLAGAVPGRKKTRRLRIVLSDRLVRYLCVEEMPGMRSARELELLASARHQQVFGQEAEGWKIVTDLEPFAQSHLSCAVSQQLLSGLIEGGRNAGYGIDSVQPAFIAAQRQWHKKISHTPCWFVLAEPDSTTIGYRSAHGWAGIRVHPEKTCDKDGLVQLLNRNRLYFCPDVEGEQQKVWVCEAGQSWSTAQPDSGWRITSLPAPFFTTLDTFVTAEGVPG